MKEEVYSLEAGCGGSRRNEEERNESGGQPKSAACLPPPLGSIFLRLFSTETLAQLVMVGDGLFEQGVVTYNLLHLMDIPS